MNSKILKNGLSSLLDNQALNRMNKKNINLNTLAKKELKKQKDFKNKNKAQYKIGDTIKHIGNNGNVFTCVIINVYNNNKLFLYNVKYENGSINTLIDSDIMI